MAARRAASAPNAENESDVLVLGGGGYDSGGGSCSPPDPRCSHDAGRGLGSLDLMEAGVSENVRARVKEAMA